jgi:hypothetical protein
LSSTSTMCELTISADDANVRLDSVGPDPAFRMRSIMNGRSVRCLLNARPRYIGSGKRNVSPKKVSTAL